MMLPTMRSCHVRSIKARIQKTPKQAPISQNEHVIVVIYLQPWLKNGWYGAVLIFDKHHPIGKMVTLLIRNKNMLQHDLSLNFLVGLERQHNHDPWHWWAFLLWLFSKVLTRHNLSQLASFVIVYSWEYLPHSEIRWKKYINKLWSNNICST
jgi:hypothetical protein